MNGGGLKGILNMTSNKISNLANPVDGLDATNKRWVESQIPKGVWNLLAYVKGSLDSHTVEYKTSDVSSVSYVKVGNDKKLTFLFANDLPNGFYMYDHDVRRSGDTGGCEVYLHGEAGLSGTNSKMLHRLWGKL